MSAVALIKFTQGPNTDLGGRAVAGSLYGGPVAITNSNNTGVTSWQIDTLYAPPGSALAVGLLAQAVSNTPVGNFVQDVPGSYRFRLTVHDALGGTDIDIRVFSVPFAVKGLIAPPYQRDPDPLPTLVSGLLGKKPNEMNFGGQEFGWSGDGVGDRRLLHQLVEIVDGLEGLPSLSSASFGQTLQVFIEDIYEPVEVIDHQGDAWVLQSSFSTLRYPGLTLINPDTLLAGHTYFGPSLTDTFVGVASGTSLIWVLCLDLVTMNGGYRSFDPVAGVYSGKVVLNAGLGAVDISVGGGFLWMASPTELYQSVEGLVGPTTTIGGFVNLTSICYDGTLANYADNHARVWATDGVLGLLNRIDMLGAVDASTPLLNCFPYAVTVGGGFVWVLATDAITTKLTLFKVNPATAAVVGSSISINAVAPLGVPCDLQYDATAGVVHVLVADAATLLPYLIAVDPITLTVDFSGVVSAGSTEAVALSVLPRIAVIDNLVCCPVAYETVPPSSAGLVVVASVAGAYTFGDVAAHRSTIFDWTKYLSALFNIAGTAVSANVTAANLSTLTGGGNTTLHTHPIVSASMLLAGDISLYDPGYVTVGAAVIDPSVSSSVNFTFAALLDVDAGRTATIRVYNQTDSTVVAGTTLTSVSTIPERVSVALIAGTTVGFPNSQKIYLLQLKADALAGPASVVSCKWAAIY